MLVVVGGFMEKRGQVLRVVITASFAAENLPTVIVNMPQESPIAVITKEEKTLAKEPILHSVPAIETDITNRRAGFDISLPVKPDVWSSRLGASWYLDWSAKEQMPVGTLEHWKTIRITLDGYKPSIDEIRKLVTIYPGCVWILGNEPDVIWQDNVLPDFYARSYHDLYYAIKGVDATASIAVAGVAQGTPLRFEYLDRVLDTYMSLYGENMPVDWWTVHGYVLREERDSWGVEIPPGIDADQGILYEIADHGRLDYFEAQLRNFRAWMATRGYQNTPLALTEFGILMPAEYGFPTDFVAQYLLETFDLLQTMKDPRYGYPPDDNRLIQRWAWFSLADPNYPNSNLADFELDQLTPVGLAFRDYVESLNSP